MAKQDEVTCLNQEGARLVADLSHAQKALYEQQNQTRQLENKLASLQAAEQRAQTLETELAASREQAQVIQEQLKTAYAKAESSSNHARDLELVLAQTQAKLEAQQEIMADMRNYLDPRRA